MKSAAGGLSARVSELEEVTVGPGTDECTGPDEVEGLPVQLSPDARRPTRLANLISDHIVPRLVPEIEIVAWPG